jgi:hypothetical protein
MNSAARELNVEAIQINDQLCFKTQAEADAVKELGERRYREESERRAAVSAGLMRRLLPHP